MGNYLLNNPDGHIPALICAENIAELCEKQSSVGIRMRAHIRELAESLIKMAELSQKEHSAVDPQKTGIFYLRLVANTRILMSGLSF